MHYDGAVLINTEIGTEDLEKDIKEVSGELGGLKGVLQKFGKTIADAFSKPVARASKEVQKDIDDCAKAIERYRAQIQKAQAAKLPFEEQTREMGAELDEAQRKLAQLQAQKAAAEKAMQLPEGRAPTGDEINAFIEAQTQLPGIQAEIEKQQAAVDNLEKKWNATCDKVDKYNNEIRQSEDLIAASEAKAEELAKELKEAEAAAKGLKKNSKDTQGGMDKAGKSVRSFTSRLKSIALGALVFNGISAGLRTMTDHFGKCLKTNDAFATALSQLKGALLTAFQPIYQAVAPALTYLTKLLTAAVLAVARLFATLTGTSLEASADAAENLYEEAEALDQVGSSAKKASKSLAGFDDLNVMQKTDQSGGSGSSSEVKPAFSWDDAELDEMEDTVKKIAKYASVAAAGFAGFKIGKFVTDLLTANNTLKNIGQKAGMTIGITLAVTGLTMEGIGIVDTIQNGLNNANFGEILSGGGTLIAGATMIGATLGNALLGGAIGGIVAGIPAFITGIYDAIVDGIDWLNATLIGVGATATGAGIGAIIGMLGGPIGAGIGALIGLAVGLVTDLVILIVQNWESISAWFGEVFTNIGQWFVNLWNGIWSGLQSFWAQFAGFWSGVGTWIYDNVIAPIANFFAELWNGIVQGVTTAWNGIVKVFSSIGSFLSGIFNTVKEAIISAFAKGGEIFLGIGEGILSVFKTVVNALIKGINFVISKPFEGLNGILKTIQGLSILGVKPFGWLSWRAPVPQIPYLAQGAVLPANKPFMAVVGDQRHGTNVEAPLTTIQEALDLALADRLEGMMAGFNAVTARQEQILAAILSLDVSDGALAGAIERYQREMAIATGGI